MPTIGYNTIGGNTGNMNPDQLEFQGPFTMTENGTAVDIQMYGTAFSNKLTFGIYHDSGGNPYDLLSNSAECTPSGTAWQSIAIGGALVNGSTYWLAVHNGVNTFSPYFDFAAAPPGGSYLLGVAYNAGSMPSFVATPTPFGVVLRSFYLNYNVSSAVGTLAILGAG